MSGKNSIDIEIKSKMATYEVKPPEEVWDSIAKQRSFGHVTTNRIMQSFLYGGLAILALVGAYLWTFENSVEAKYSPVASQSLLNNQSSLPEKIVLTTFMENESIKKSDNVHETAVTASQNIPSQDITASVNSLAFLLDPELFADQSLRRLLQNIEDISVVKPFELVRYERLNKIASQSANTFKVEQQAKQYDYYYVSALQGKKKPFSMLITFSPEFINKDFQLKNFLPAGYADQRQDYLRSRKAYTFSSRLDYHFGKYSFVELGLDWTKISETLQFGSSTHSSEFSFLNIPILFGQELHYNRIGWQMKAGVAYQFHSSYAGKILGADGIRIIDLDNSNENPYRKAGVFNLHIATGVSYQYTENLHLLLEPYYKRSLNSITEEETPFSEKVEYMGIAFGVKLDI